MRIRFSSAFLLAAGLACAQKASYDVASVKAAAPQPDGRIMMRMGGDPGMVDYNHVSLRLLIQNAFGVKDYQVVAPDWAGTAFFDVQAKLPPDTPPERRREMLQTLLEERFGLKIHKETKEAPIYALVVGKNGPKMKEVEAPPQPKPGDGPQRPPALRPDGPPPKATAGMIMMRIEGPGKMRMNAGAMQMSNFVDMLARQVDRPVIDETGLKGYYDVDFEFKPEGNMMRGMPVGPRADGGGGAPSGGPAPEQVEAPSVFTAVQDQLGLKLESKKGPIETIVVDHLEKSPIEN